MIDITPYLQKLEYLKEWMFLRIDKDMRKQIVIHENTHGHSITHDIRNFEAYCRHKNRNYTNKWLKSIFK